MGEESSIKLPGVELPDLHKEKGPDPLKCTNQNVLMINQGKTALVSLNLCFPGKSVVSVQACENLLIMGEVE